MSLTQLCNAFPFPFSCEPSVSCLVANVVVSTAVTGWIAQRKEGKRFGSKVGRSCVPGAQGLHLPALLCHPHHPVLQSFLWLFWLSSRDCRLMAVSGKGTLEVLAKDGCPLLRIFCRKRQRDLGERPAWVSF